MVSRTDQAAAIESLRYESYEAAPQVERAVRAGRKDLLAIDGRGRVSLERYNPECWKHDPLDVAKEWREKGLAVIEFEDSQQFLSREARRFRSNRRRRVPMSE